MLFGEITEQKKGASFLNQTPTSLLLAWIFVPFPFTNYAIKFAVTYIQNSYLF